MSPREQEALALIERGMRMLGEYHVSVRYDRRDVIAGGELWSMSRDAHHVARSIGRGLSLAEADADLRKQQNEHYRLIGEMEKRHAA
jgi:hypothetical protein